MRTLLSLSIAFLWLTPSVAQLPAEHSPLAKYIDSQTIGVAWIDMRAVDGDALEAFMSQLDFGPGSSLKNDAAQAVQNALLELGVERVYALADLNSLIAGEPRLVLPCKNPDAVALFLNSIGEKSGFRFEKDEQNVVGRKVQGTPNASKEDKSKGDESKDGEPTDALLAAMTSCSGPHAAVLVTPPYLSMSAMNVVQAMLQKDNVVEVARAAESLSAISSVAFSGSLPPGPAIFRIETNTVEDAKKLSDLIVRLTTNALASRRIPNKDQQLELLKFNVKDSAVELRMSSVDQAVAKMLALRDVITAGRSPQTTNSMKQIALALHYYDATYNALPPQSLVDTRGNRLLSWRVLILPFLGEQALYAQFKLDEPWDSPHNLKLAESMPAVYGFSTAQEAGPKKTRMLAALTKDSAFGKAGKPITFQQVTDGTSNTIWFVEAPEDRSVVWTKPDDLVVDPQAPLDSVLGAEDEGLLFSRMDGSVFFLEREKLNDETIQALLTIAGGEVIPQNK